MYKEGISPQENFVFWKNVVLSFVFFLLTPLTIFVSIFSLFTIQSQKKSTAQSIESTKLADAQPPLGVKLYASLPEGSSSISQKIEAIDARAEIIKKYLNRYDSPLLPYAEKIVEIADKYHIDFRLIPAIAQQESNLCKIIPPETYNCWGWGIHSRGTLGFESYEEGIETVSKGIREEYLNKGYDTVDLIMTKYTPSSPGSWARGVNQFMAEMQ